MPRPRNLFLLLVLLFACTLAANAKERVMFGDDIYVGPDETLDEVVCIFCSVTIDGHVGDAVAIMGGMRINGEVQQDAVAIMGGMDIYGQIHGDLAAIMGGAKLHSGASVGGDAVAVLGGIDLGDGTSIGGDTVSVLGGISKGVDAVIGGDEVVEGEGLAPAAAVLFGVILLGGVVLAIALGPVLAAITLAIAGEDRIETVRQTLNQRFGMCFLVGIGIFVGGFILSIMLGIALFWLPGANTLVTVATFIVSAVGYAGLGLWVGRGLIRSGGAMGATVLGSILVTFVQLIPVIGWFILWPIFFMVALGAATVSGFGTSVDWLLPRSESEPMVRPT